MEHSYYLYCSSQVAQVVKNPAAKTGDTRDTGSIPGLERSPGVGNGNPLQYFCLENPMDREAWWSTVHEITKSDMTEHTEHSGKVSKPCSVSEEGWTIIDKSYRKLQTAVCARAKSLPSCLTLCDPVECSPPGFSVHGILQAKILERVAMASSRGASRLRDRICGFLKCPVSAGGFLNTSTPPEAP